MAVGVVCVPALIFRACAHAFLPSAFHPTLHACSCFTTAMSVLISVLFSFISSLALGALVYPYVDRYTECVVRKKSRRDDK